MAFILCLFYVIYKFLPRDYTHHLALLVRSMHILLGTSISTEDLKSAHSMLCRFYELIPSLYPQTMCTMNAHSLIHICEFVRRWGPLWCYSAFGFENFNGFMKKHCHGTRNVLPQLIRAVQLHQALPMQMEQVIHGENEATKTFLHSVCPVTSNRNNGPLGRIVHRSLTSTDKTVISRAGYQLNSSTLPSFSRYFKNGVLFIVYKSSNQRDSSVCKVAINSEVFYGRIRKFFLVSGISVVILTLFEHSTQCIFTESMQYSSLLPQDITAARNVKTYIIKVKKLTISSKIIAISANNILEKCVLIPIPNSPHDLIVTQPNVFEHH